MDFRIKPVKGGVAFAELAQDELGQGDLELQVVEVDLQPGVVLSGFGAEGDFTVDETLQGGGEIILVEDEFTLVGGMLLADAGAIFGLVDGRDGVRVVQIDVDHFSSILVIQLLIILNPLYIKRLDNGFMINYRIYILIQWFR